MFDRIRQGLISLLGDTRSLENPKTPLSNPDAWLFTALGAIPTYSGASINEKTALQISAVFACVRVIAESIGSLPLHVYRRQEPRGREQARQRREYALLHDAPNNRMTACVFREVMTAHVLLYGNGYALIEQDGSTKTKALWPLIPSLVRVEMDSEGGLVYVVHDAVAEKDRSYSYEQIIHIPGLSFDGVCGLSPIALHREGIGLAKALEQFGAEYFGNGTSLTGALKLKKNLTADAQDRLRNAWTNTHGTPGRRHKVAVLEEGMEWTSIQQQADQAQFIESRKFQISEIARVFRVPAHLIGDLDKATFCLPAGTEILTEGGPKRIETINTGEMVWSRANGTWTKQRVVRSLCSGEDEILTIKTTNRTIRANAKHRILTRRKYSTPQAGRGGYQCVRWKDEYVAAGELKLGDTLIVLDGKIENSNNSRRFIRSVPERRVISPGFMEFCGLLLGDGNVYPGYVTIARASNARYMDHYRDVMQTEFISNDGGNGRGNLAVATAPVRLTEGERYTRFASILAAKELIGLGLNGTAWTKIVPEWIYSLDSELQLAFLRGFFDADGHVDKKGRMSASSCNRDLLSGMRHLCMMSGIPVTNLRCQRGRTTLPNGKRQEFAQWSFTCSDPGANARIGSNDPIDNARIEQGKPFNKKGRAYPRFGGFGAVLNGVSLSRIASITKTEAEPVYDLEVENSHNFIADGVVVHNSNIEHQSLDFVEHTLRPWLVRWEQELNRKLFPGGEYFAEHNIDGLLRGDFQTRMTGYASGRQWGWLSVNDIREKEGLNPLKGDDGDQYLVPTNMTTPELLANPPEPEPMPVAAPTQPEEPPANRSKQEIKRYLRPMFADAIRRTLTYESKDPSKLERFVSRAFVPIMCSLAEIANTDQDLAISYADSLHTRVAEWANEMAKRESQPAPMEPILERELELAFNFIAAKEVTA